jgi:glutamine amidotransferase
VIALVDYRAGNLTSVKKALAAVDAHVCLPTKPHELASASAIVIPGVGHFGATRALGSEWTRAILEFVEEGRPLLGICLGMQWLFEGSEEAPELKGLGLMPGICTRLRSRDPVRPPVKVPHVGWNSLSIERDAWITNGVADGAQVYFTHSYAAPIVDDAVAISEHGNRFAAIVQRGHIAGVQFHPEKSGEAGLTMLANFVRLVA